MGPVLRLREIGHDVIYAAEITPAIIDAELMTRASAEGRLLLTEDKDFGDLVFRQRRAIPGVILLRIDPARHKPRNAGLRPPSIVGVKNCRVAIPSLRKQGFERGLCQSCKLARLPRISHRSLRATLAH
ncbi:MAG TPA: DUF5615 family PIN-like protein [Xanthobacteraceae bacterium]|nr:DUF5615 family PIN-like protein [Xanthobacteraceae bacterium]